MTSTLLRADRVGQTHRVRGGATRTVLDDVSIEVAPGRCLGVIGHSGAGKSTLIRVLAGLETPRTGRVLLDGDDVAGRSRSGTRRLRRSLQIVFQDPMSSLNPRMRVHSVVAEPLRSLGVGGEGARVPEVLDLVGLPASAAGRWVHEFSGGQRQRIAIARALAPRPRVLLADEPVSALDVSVRAQILNLFADLVADLGVALVLVSHDMRVVRHLCDTVLVMADGRVVARGTGEDLPTAPAASAPRQPTT